MYVIGNSKILEDKLTIIKENVGVCRGASIAQDILHLLEKKHGKILLASRINFHDVSWYSNPMYHKVCSIKSDYAKHEKCQKFI